MNVCVIPARAGSKRLPGKNRLKINDVYNIELLGLYAKETKLFDKIFCLTNEEDLLNNIKGIETRNRYYGGTGPHATFVDVVNEVIKKEPCDNVCLLYSTALFIKVFDIMAGYEQLINKKRDSVIPVVVLESHYENLLYAEDDKLRYYSPTYSNVNLHDRKHPYRHAGQYIWINVKAFNNQQQIVMGNTGFEVLPYAIDIDTLDDLNLARKYLRSIKIMI